MYTVIILSDTYGNKTYYDVSHIELINGLVRLTMPEKPFPYLSLTIDAISSIHIIIQGLTE